MNETESLVYWSDESQLMGYGESDSSGCWLKFQVTPEDLEKFRGLKGTVFHHTLVKVQDIQTEYEKREEKPKTEIQKPFGQLASQLYKNGFFHTQKDNHFIVCEAIGSPENHLEWIRQQPCVKSGQFDYHKDEATGIVTEKCEAAHYNGDNPGKGIKTDYSAIPLIHQWHKAQHDYGYGVFVCKDILTFQSVPTFYHSESDKEFAGRDWMRSQAAKYRQQWAKEVLLKELNKAYNPSPLVYKGLGNVEPEILYQWALENNVQWALPEGYKS